MDLGSITITWSSRWGYKLHKVPRDKSKVGKGEERKFNGKQKITWWLLEFFWSNKVAKNRDSWNGTHSTSHSNMWGWWPFYFLWNYENTAWRERGCYLFKFFFGWPFTSSYRACSGIYTHINTFACYTPNLYACKCDRNYDVATCKDPILAAIAIGDRNLKLNLNTCLVAVYSLRLYI